jgi:hypothetical protein
MNTKRLFLSSWLGLFSIITFSSLCPVIGLCQSEEHASPDNVLIADGTAIHLVLMDDMQGKKLQVNQTVHFTVREELVINSRTVVKTGAEAIGHVQQISKNGLLGKSGKLVVQFDYVIATSGAKIPLRGGAGVSGGKGGALTWESALWFGPDANMPVGTKINAYVNQDQRITIP